MSLLSRISALFEKKPPPRIPQQPIPGYSYWDYRHDLENVKLSIDDIIERAGGKIPPRPRYPKNGEVWEFKECPKHRADYTGYPLQYIGDDGWPGKQNIWPFLFCGCLYYKRDDVKPT